MVNEGFINQFKVKSNLFIEQSSYPPLLKTVFIEGLCNFQRSDTESSAVFLKPVKRQLFSAVAAPQFLWKFINRSLVSFTQRNREHVAWLSRQKKKKKKATLWFALYLSFPIRTKSTPFFVLFLHKKVRAAGEGESCLQQVLKTQLLMDYCFCLRPEYIHSSNIFYFNISQTVVLSGFINKRNWSKTYRHCIGNPEKFDT